MKDAHAYAERTIPELYRWFAGEAAPTSPTWEAVSLWVAGTPSIAGRLDTLPGSKRQPNLFLGALKYLGAPLEPGAALEAWVGRHWAEIEAVILRRATQTNEPGRCAVIAPVLASLPQPVALLEVGASAGLCLAPDRFRYRYAGSGGPTHGAGIEAPGSGDGAGIGSIDSIVRGHEARADAPVLDCRVTGVPPGGVEDLRIAARAGLDRNPLRADDPDDVRWLKALVWPDEPAREARLAAALETVGRAAPTILRGDAVADLDRLLALAPSGATAVGLALSGVAPVWLAPSGVTPVVLHSATLAYLTEADRDAFIAKVRASGARWLSFEGVGVLREVRERVPDAEAHRDTPHFIIALDGEPLGFCSPHGGWVHWYAQCGGTKLRNSGGSSPNAG